MDPAEPRAAYYGAWDAFAAEQAARLKGEAAAETAASERCALPCALPAQASSSAPRRDTAAELMMRAVLSLSAVCRALGLGDAAKAAATSAKREALRAAKAQWAATQDREAQAKARPARSASLRWLAQPLHTPHSLTSARFFRLPPVFHRGPQRRRARAGRREPGRQGGGAHPQLSRLRVHAACRRRSGKAFHRRLHALHL